MTRPIRHGMIVVKKSGRTEFIGRVVIAYETEPGEERIHVMSIAPGSRRHIHIYMPDQLRPATPLEIDRIERMTAIWEGRDD